MSSLDRTLEGDVLVHHLRRDEQTIDADLVAKHGRSARTLVKEGSLRLTLMALAPDGKVPVHATAGMNPMCSATVLRNSACATVPLLACRCYCRITVPMIACVHCHYR
jgi:hypothetical protein